MCGVLVPSLASPQDGDEAALSYTVGVNILEMSCIRATMANGNGWDGMMWLSVRRVAPLGPP